MNDESAELVEVRIEGLPLDLLARAEEHADDLRRELALVAQSSKTPRSQFPVRLVNLFAELEREYAAVGEAAESQLTSASVAGVGSVDLVLTVPRSAAGACVRLEETLDEADRYCADGSFLLNLVSPPDIVALRRWYLGEFIRQIDGEPATPWPRWAAEHS